MGLITLNLATLKARGLGDPSKHVCLLGKLSNPSVNVSAVQETHFTCVANCQVLEDYYAILSAYGWGLLAKWMSPDVNLVLADDGGWLVVADVAVKDSSSEWSWFMHPIWLSMGFLLLAVRTFL